MPTIKIKKEKTAKPVGNPELLERVRKEKEETNIAINDIKNEIFEKSKANLPTLLKTKVDEVIKEVIEVVDERKKSYVYEETKFGEKLDFIDYGLVEARIAPIIASKSSNFYVCASYSADELYIIFQEFVRMISEINKNIKYLPTKKKFCLFAGMSTATYNNYIQDFDENKRNVMQMIDDYITDVNLSSAQQGEIREITTMFRSKAEHGMIEAQAPIVIEHQRQLNMEEIREKLSRFKEVKVVDAEFVEKEPN